MIEADKKTALPIDSAVLVEVDSSLGLELGDLDILEAINLTVFTVVLDGDVALCVHAVVKIGGLLSIDEDLEMISFADDLVLDPLAERCLVELGLTSFCVCWVKPFAATFIVESASPCPVGWIAFSLIAKHFVLLYMAPEHDA